MKIAVRMDDIAPGMNRKRFEAFKALLDEYQVKPLIGVVPDNQDENLNKEVTSNKEIFWQEIMQLQSKGWIVAQHGYQHVYTEKKGGLFPLNHFSEFAGKSYEKQKEMISKGKEILSKNGIETDIFMAPAHSYDKNTLRALVDNGFTKLTDGFGKAPYVRAGIIFYPIAFRLKGDGKNKSGITTMVIHTNTMNEADMLRCRKILETGNVVSYQEYIDMPAIKRGTAGNMIEYLAAAAKHLLVKLL